MIAPERAIIIAFIHFSLHLVDNSKRIRIFAAIKYKKDEKKDYTQFLDGALCWTMLSTDNKEYQQFCCGQD